MAFILGKMGLFRPKTPPLSQKPVVMYEYLSHFSTDLDKIWVWIGAHLL